jgi:hypothetical protein
MRWPTTQPARTTRHWGGWPGPDSATPRLTNSTATGARADVTESNALVLGSINGIDGATADTLVGPLAPKPHQFCTRTNEPLPLQPRCIEQFTIPRVKTHWPVIFALHSSEHLQMPHI